MSTASNNRNSNRNRKPAVRSALAIGLMAVTSVLAGSSSVASAQASEEDNSWMYADGGSLGATVGDTTDNTWCIVDASSLGHPDALGACS